MPWGGPLAALGERLELPPGAPGPLGTAWARLGARGSAWGRCAAPWSVCGCLRARGNTWAPESAGGRLGALR
eukprot:5002435-Pyramimonas_sp.AAC.1